VGLEWSPLSLVSIIERFADNRRSLGRYRSLADSGHGILSFILSLVSSLMSFSDGSDSECASLGESATETLAMIGQVFGEYGMSRTRVSD
jgi:hypothetical protein